MFRGTGNDKFIVIAILENEVQRIVFGPVRTSSSFASNFSTRSIIMTPPSSFMPPKIAALASHPAQPESDRGRLSQVERATILATLDECNGNRTHAAKKLGISRRALIYKLRVIEAEAQ